MARDAMKEKVKREDGEGEGRKERRDLSMRALNGRLRSQSLDSSKNVLISPLFRPLSRQGYRTSCVCGVRVKSI